MQCNEQRSKVYSAVYSVHYSLPCSVMYGDPIVQYNAVSSEKCICVVLCDREYEQCSVIQCTMYMQCSVQYSVRAVQCVIECTYSVS